MPVVTFVGGEMQDDVKAELIKGLTDVVCNVTKAPAQYVTVIVSENKDTNIGLGGETLVEFKARLHAESSK